MTTQQRKIVLAITACYTLMILYFMLLAFGRTGTVDREAGYTFLFFPLDFFRLPSLSELLLHPTVMDLVGIGNVAAFIPFGLLIPLLYRISFIRFIALFILSILAIETIQALTMLGSFDLNDVIQNSIGAAIGFGAYKIGFRTTNVRRNIVVTGISVVILLGGVWGSFGIVDKAFVQELGDFVALNELKHSSGNPSTKTKPYSFKVGGQDVEPKYNVYSAEGKQFETYTYSLGNKELYIYLNYGIPDQENLRGSLCISVDGQEYLSVSAADERQEPEISSLYVEQAKELTITIEGNEKVWDVGFREMKYSWNW
ncbi:VanZ family protein [Cohnella sp. LGH]|uniref:VanZ family protein n=1 Tax=Cohnella sp. LGH TaxID=1619153 RepID=UPI001AD9DF2B|nr:VanZ family protein [Cohnella sp. LGH]QTH42737.1 VanZ family protein [Cohnella sp. LGH]